MGTEKRKGSFVKQAAILAAAGLLVRVMGFLYRLPLTALIGDEGNGIYAAGYYIYQFMLIVSSAGLPAAISRMVSERLALGQKANAHKVFRVAMAISAGVCFVAMMALLLFGRQLCAALQYDRSYYCILTLAPTLLIVGILSVYRGYFQGMHTMVPTAISQLVEQLFNAVFSVLLAYLLVGKGVEYGAAGGTAGTGVGALAGLGVVAFAYALIRPRLLRGVERDVSDAPRETNREIARLLIRTAVPIIVGTALFSISNLSDMFMVKSRLMASGAFTEARAEALYGQLSGKYATLTTLPVAISTAMATAAIPSIAASVAQKNKKAVDEKINTTFRVGMLISIPAAVGIGVLGDPIIRMLFPSYAEGGVLLTVGAFSIVLLALSQIITGILQGIGRLRIPMIGALCGLVVKIICNYFLIGIPDLNVVGAVLATTACYLVAVIVNMTMLVRETGAHLDFMGGFIKPAIASAGMGVGCLLVYKLLVRVAGSNTLGVLASILVSMAVYFALLLLLRAANRDDILLLPMGGRLVRVLERRHLL